MKRWKRGNAAIAYSPYAHRHVLRLCSPLRAFRQQMFPIRFPVVSDRVHSYPVDATRPATEGKKRTLTCRKRGQTLRRGHGHTHDERASRRPGVTRRNRLERLHRFGTYLTGIGLRFVYVSAGKNACYVAKTNETIAEMVHDTDRVSSGATGTRETRGSREVLGSCQPQDPCEKFAGGVVGLRGARGVEIGWKESRNGNKAPRRTRTREISKGQESR